VQKFNFVLESATLIAELICRCAIFESLFLQSASAAADELKRAVIQLYVNIMTYLAKAKAYCREHIASWYFHISEDVADQRGRANRQKRAFDAP